MLGVWQAGDQLPSVRSLAAEMRINPNTIQRAYGELEREGFVYTLAGKGCFVEEDLHALKNKKMTDDLLVLKGEIEALRVSGIHRDAILRVIDEVYKEDGNDQD